MLLTTGRVSYHTERFSRSNDEKEITAIIAKTELIAADGKYELFKTSSHFGTTAKHPDWLGDDSPVRAETCAAECGVGELGGWLQMIADLEVLRFNPRKGERWVALCL
jgi:hypothetical protein